MGHGAMGREGVSVRVVARNGAGGGSGGQEIRVEKEEPSIHFLEPKSFFGTRVIRLPYVGHTIAAIPKAFAYGSVSMVRIASTKAPRTPGKRSHQPYCAYESVSIDGEMLPKMKQSGKT